MEKQLVIFFFSSVMPASPFLLPKALQAHLSLISPLVFMQLMAPAMFVFSHVTRCSIITIGCVNEPPATLDTYIGLISPPSETVVVR